MEINNNCEASDKHMNKQIKERKKDDEQTITIKKPTSKILIIILSMIIISLCAVLVIFIIKSKKNNKTEKEFETQEVISENETKDLNKPNNNLENFDNKIRSIYEVKSGQKMSFFNVNYEKNLRDEDYFIKDTSFPTNNLRNLKILDIKNGFYIPSYTGLLSVEIIFKKKLNNLENFFLNNKELVKVNMNDFEMKDVISMKSMFSGCSNLNEVTFEGANSQNLINLDNTFENCTKLKNINLSLNNTSKLEEVNNTFFGCENLESINLTTFTKIGKNMFGGIKSTPTIIANELISNDISNIFLNEFNIKIKIINKIEFQIEECEIGEGEKCKTCSSINIKNCLTCNDEFYLPFDADNIEKCLSCKNKIEGCISCFGNVNFIICLACEYGYTLGFNKCEKNETKIENCIIGDNELCKNCNSDEKLRNECGDCNEGYYLPSNTQNKTFCENCNKSEGCIDCSGTKESPICSKCLNGYKLVDDKCIEESCILGENEKCKSCKNEIGKKKECKTCNDGYYLSENNYFECVKCSVKNCKKCSRNLTQEICEECNDFFILMEDNSCKCPKEYILTNETNCQKNGNWIETEYYISDNKSVFDFLLLDQGNPPHINLDDIEMFINDTRIPISLYNYRFYYNFTKLGEYKIKINIKKQLYSMRSMFMNIQTLKKITFREGFESSKVTDMSLMFCGCYAEMIDISHLKIDNLVYLEKFLWGADYLKTFNNLNPLK